MSTVEIVSIVGVCYVGLGLILTWIRIGQDRSKQSGALEEKVNNIDKKLDDLELTVINGEKELLTKLNEVKAEVGNFKTHCASISSGLTQRVDNHARRLADLEKD